MSTTYADYTRDRIGWFFGISGGQLVFLAIASLPMFWALSQGAWLSALLLAGIWAFVLLVTIVPVHGRSATGWLRWPRIPTSKCVIRWPSPWAPWVRVPPWPL